MIRGNPMKFRCVHCNQKLNVEDDLAGSEIPCPACNRKLQIPDAFDEESPDEEPSPEELAERRPKLRSAALRGGGKAEFTNVSALWSGLTALGLSVAFYLVMFLIKGTYLGQLFTNRGIIPYFEVLLMFWSAAILFWKWRKLVKQQRGMHFDLLPDEIAPKITSDNVDQFLDRVTELPVRPTESFLIMRVLRVLEHFRARNNNSEAAGLLATQSDIDANAVASSYSLVKVFIWAIPILGFIGTVSGLGIAVGGFGGSIGDASDISAVKDSLTSITGGLSEAFDTTFIALIMSLFLMIPMSSLQKGEDELLNSIDEYCNEYVLRRLSDSSGLTLDEQKAGVDVSAALMRQLENIDQTLAQLNRTLAGLGGGSAGGGDGQA